MHESQITKKRLANGITIVTIDLPHFHSVNNALITRSGSRSEEIGEHGLAHFLEHLMFKGTSSYPTSAALAEALEQVGGYSNAWTSYDNTVYWNVVPRSQYKLGVQLPLEMAFRPLLQDVEINRERSVIIEEIRRTNDDPASLIWDISQQTTYGPTPLGRPILGTAESVLALTPEQIRSYHAKHYTPDQTYVLAVGGISDIPNFMDYITAQYQDLPAKIGRVYEPFTGQSQHTVRVVSRPTEQAHCIIAVTDPAFALTSAKQYADAVLDTILGTGMSSRLFMNVRERKGLAYSVYSRLSYYEEVGDLSIYAGVTVDKIDDALAAISEELTDLATTLVSEAELDKAKNMLLGSFDISSDSPHDLISWYGTSAMLGMKLTREEAKAHIKQVTAEQVRDLAKRIFVESRLSITVIGPYEADRIFKLTLPA